MKYNILKKSRYKKYLLINVNTSFDMRKKKDKDSIGTIKFYSIDMINKVIKRNIDNKFKKILELIVSTDEDGNPPDGLLLCLDEVAKFKREIINKYERYLIKKQIEVVNKKIEIIEKDLKNKLVSYTLIQKSFRKMNSKAEEYDEEIERHHTR